MPEMLLEQESNDNSDLFKFASARELYIAAASSALQGIPDRYAVNTHAYIYIFLVALQLICTCMYNYNYSDGSLTRKQIHECLKADEVETISILYMY